MLSDIVGMLAANSQICAIKQYQIYPRQTSLGNYLNHKDKKETEMKTIFRRSATIIPFYAACNFSLSKPSLLFAVVIK